MKPWLTCLLVGHRWRVNLWPRTCERCNYRPPYQDGAA